MALEVEKMGRVRYQADGLTDGLVATLCADLLTVSRWGFSEVCHWE